MESKLVTREDLYNQVWSTPTTRLATNYGISDVALGKICKKLSIPKPPPGYWARVAAGYKPKKTPLPKVRPNQEISVRIWASEVRISSYELDSETEEIIDRLKQRNIVVPTNLDCPHRLIKSARKHLRTRKPDQYGRLWPVEESVDIRVSKASLKRGLLIMNTIFRELESVGYRVYISPRGQTVVEKEGAILTLALYERANRKENSPPKEDAPWWTYDRYSFEPSGEIEITLGRWPIGESRWKDTAVKRLEDRISDILIRLSSLRIW